MNFAIDLKYACFYQKFKLNNHPKLNTSVAFTETG